MILKFEKISCSLNATLNYAGTSLNKGGAGGAIAPPYFVRIEGAAGQRRRAALLLAHPDFQTQRHP